MGNIKVVFSRFNMNLLYLGCFYFIVNHCQCLHLTNMTAPSVQDPRNEMLLHCKFDMGGEELYAVKWYKDDHEFYRYTPGATETITQFTVPGVHVERRRSQCMRDRCDLILSQLIRPQSSGAYRCEVSSEAPAFRLASQTHNVTVAALPETPPVIEGLSDSYLIGDLLLATCTSGMGDPKPTITWYINNQQVSSKSIKELPSRTSDQPYDRIILRSTTMQIKLPIDKKLVSNQPSSSIDITCKSSVDGIKPSVAPPLVSTKQVMILDQNQLVNNQKLHWPDSSASSIGGDLPKMLIVFILTVIVMRWC